MKRLAVLLSALALAASITATAFADAPARERELTCSDGTTFTGEQVRMGNGTPPRTFRNVVAGADPAAFNFHAAAVIAPDGTVVERLTWDYAQGVEQNHELVTCSFIIPIGPLTGYTATFDGFFVPAGDSVE
ncbi:MAG TPA: hypothetical protein VFR32_06495 [Gaiellaceae bacterium]|nr:hypothetical protein [Gaiellaceae bacterium]